MFEYILIFSSAVILSYLSILLFSEIFFKLGIVDDPQKYGKKRDPVPYSMGIVFSFVFFLVTAVFVDYHYKLWLIWFFGFLISLVSFVDDRLDLAPISRLLIQVLIGATIALTSIKIGYVSGIFWEIIDLETISFSFWTYVFYIIPFLFTIAWYVFIFNALNWADGLSGNASGLSVISFFILFLLGIILFQNDDYEGGVSNAIFIMKLCLVLVWILLPFWFYDVREKILMWDSGTMYLGFMLATIAIIAGGKIATVLVVFGIYSVDAIYVIFSRLIAKKNPLKWDFNHLHHRLQRAGLSKSQFLSLVYGLSLFFGLTALFLDRTWKIIVFLLIVFIVIFINRLIDWLSPNTKIQQLWK